jgi:hypothetical protein
MNLEDLDREVRESLIAHAEDAPDGSGTLDAVRARSRRRQLRHRATVASVAAVVAVAVAIGTPYLLIGTRHASHGPLSIGGPNGSTAPAFTSSTITATSPPATPSHPTRVPLGAPTFTPVTFPMNPTFTPAGLPAPTEGKTVGEVRLVYSSPTGKKGIIAAVDVSNSGVPFTPSTHKATTVNGHPVTIYTGTSDGVSQVDIVWRLHGKWVSVLGSDLSSAKVQQYANGLADRPRAPGRLPFTLALAPHGYAVAFQEIHPELSPPEFYVNLSAPGQLNNQSTDDAVGVVSRADIASAATGESITVGGYPGKINHDPDGQVTVYVLRPGFNYAVHEPENGPLSDTDLIRFAAGVAPTR